MKKLLILAITVILIWLMSSYPHIMLNPGELVQAHQQLNNKCLSCHNPFWGIDNSKCISCHKLSEIGIDSAMNADTVVQKNKILFHEHFTKQECISCHTDHLGINANIILSDFNHDLLGSTLISNCSSCHAKPIDKLHKQLSTSCNSCHNTAGWKSDVIFNHDLLQGIEKNNCTSCHQMPADNYHASFNDNCNKCHNTLKWIPSTFNHSNYFLLDKHHNSKCITCHNNNNFSSYTCFGCHEHSQSNIFSEHTEEGISNINDCAACHKSGNEHDIIKEGNRRNNLNPQDINSIEQYIKPEEKTDKKENDDD